MSAVKLLVRVVKRQCNAEMESGKRKWAAQLHTPHRFLPPNICTRMKCVAEHCSLEGSNDLPQHHRCLPSYHGEVQVCTHVLRVCHR